MNELYNTLDVFFEQEFGYSLSHNDVTVYIIGSFADGTFSKSSDIDVLVTQYPIKLPSGQIYPNEISYKNRDHDLHLSVTGIDGVNKEKPHVLLTE